MLIELTILIVVSVLYASKKQKSEPTPTIQTKSYPLGPVNNSPQGYESPYYEQYYSYVLNKMNHYY